MSDLTPKQAKFVEEYIVDLNATQAAIRAGYSKDTAEQIGYQQLQKTSVTEALKVKQAALAEKMQINQEWVITRLQQVAERCMQAEPVLDRDGAETGEYIFQAAGANKALELIGKHLGLFNDKLDVNITKRNINITIDLYADGRSTPELASQAENSVPQLSN